MELDLIETGKFYADGGAMFGAIPKTSWIRRYPCDDRNGCLLSMRCALVTTGDGRVVLIDTGCGEKQLGSLTYYRFFGLKDMGEELRRRGIAPEQITDVVLTHLHFDHCGYATLKDAATGDVSPAFPHAEYWVSEAQWLNFLNPHPLEKDSYFPENIMPVTDAGKLRLVTGDTDLCNGIQLRLYQGHTPGQLVSYIGLPEQTVVFAGDVIPLAASVSPAWISAYDSAPLISYTEKIRMLEEAAACRQRIVFCHDAYTVSGEIKKCGDFYKVIHPCLSEEAREEFQR